ncbi:type VII secretion-associated serine protease mycosin [Kitasatospora sp. P5_F3]
MAAGLLLTTAPLASADQVRDGQWPIQQLNLEKAWSVSKGSGVIVAVIDSGMDVNHPDLAGQVLPGFDPGGKGREKVPTGDGHGTSMASIIAAKGQGNGAGMIGVAPGAKILPIYKASAENLDAIPEGIRWATDHDAKVINISQGGIGAPDEKTSQAVAYALSKDVLVVSAAGNSGISPVESPANTPGILAVGAVDKSGKIWSGSNYGPEVLLVAPGDEIVSAGNCSGSKYCIGNGTSTATAYVSGAAALLRAKFPNLTAGQIANRLAKSAKAPTGLKLPDERYGYGSIRPYEALTQDIAAGPAQGPLAKTTASGAPSAAPSAAVPAPGGAAPGGSTGDEIKSESFSFLGKGLAIAGVVLLVLVLLFIGLIVLIVRAAKRRRAAASVPPGPAPYGYPQAQPPYPNQPYGSQPPMPGQPPYGNQSPQQPPYPNPYGSGQNQ